MPSTPFRHPGFASSPRRHFPRTAGFSLMEILVVLAIIGLLAGLAISNIDSIFGNAKLTTAQLFVKTSLKNSLGQYRFQMNDYPSTAEGLQALITAPSTKADRWHGPYIEGGKVPLDPWDEPYQYRYPGTKNKGGYDLYSKGPDKIADNEDDIGNWDPPAAPAAK